ncbi:cell division protein FtsQ/DivIB [Demequina lignilytica]|uniref:Cell division protein FtsQ/DivIB n=1 Tax=Demequina lignilytica TaxID=3051663 RepID=A0AB35MJS7_9MICO|nr:cell division protein FtsQ/DivIB [Demequina sp. SYSU T0a273]MDN4483960.1 cell division protein FtsQ/DivIB [Demequina sp. SYSU T0a273]
MTAEHESLAAPWRRGDGERRARPAGARTAPAAPEARDAGPSVRSRVASALHVGRRRAAPMVDAAGARVGTVTTRLQARLRERARAQRRLSAVVWARRAGYLAIVGLVAWLVLASPVFALDPAEVETTGYGTVVEPADVSATVAQFEGQSLATLSTSRLADALREIPGVRDAAIERVWPAGLLIELTSREPVAAVPVEDGYAFVDSEATTVGRADEAPDDLPVVTIPVGEDHTRVLAAVLGVINQLPVELRDRVQDVSAGTEDTVTFELRDGPRVEWGSAEDSALKAEVLQVLLDSGQADGATVIDVSAPTLPITRS